MPIGNQIIVPGEALAQPAEVGLTPNVGGMYPPSIPALINTSQSSQEGEGFVAGAQVPGMGPIITVNTRAEDFMADGIMPIGMNRQPRRSFRGGMSPMMPSVSRYTPMEGGNGMSSSVSSGAPITITKLE